MLAEGEEGVFEEFGELGGDVEGGADLGVGLGGFPDGEGFLVADFAEDEAGEEGVVGMEGGGHLNFRF